MALHHVADPAALLARLAAYLRPGGVCVVLDFLPEEQQDVFGGKTLEERLEGVEDEGVRRVVMKAMSMVQTHGFGEGTMRELFEGAGLGGGVEYVVREEPFEFTIAGVGIHVKCFFARGEKVGE